MKAWNRVRAISWPSALTSSPASETSLSKSLVLSFGSNFMSSLETTPSIGAGAGAGAGACA